MKLRIQLRDKAPDPTLQRLSRSSYVAHDEQSEAKVYIIKNRPLSVLAGQNPDTGMVDIGYHYLRIVPMLTTECRGNRIILYWTVPDWVVQHGLLQDFEIYRYEPVSESSTLIPINDPDARMFVDTDVEEDTTYCYRIRFGYQNFCTGIMDVSPYSTESCNELCPPTPLGPMDIAFIVDNTGSMGIDPLNNLRDGITTIITDIEAASGEDYRLALVTPDENDVRVRVTFSQNNRVAFQDGLDLVLGSSGVWPPESTDECLNTILNALFASGREDPRDCRIPPPPLQTGDFTPGFRPIALKLVVLITDHEPGGFCDFGDNGAQAAIYAAQARTNCVRINAVQVRLYNGTLDQAAQAVMFNYEQTTCGWFSDVPNDGTGIVEAVVRMLYADGYCNCP